MVNMVTPKPGTPTEELRIRFGYRVIIVGFLLIALTLIVLAVMWTNRGSTDLKVTELASIVATVTGIVGTVVGAFFGINAAGSARDQMNVARKEAQDTSNRALAFLPEQHADHVLAN